MDGLIIKQKICGVIEFVVRKCYTYGHLRMVYGLTRMESIVASERKKKKKDVPLINPANYATKNKTARRFCPSLRSTRPNVPHRAVVNGQAARWLSTIFLNLQQDLAIVPTGLAPSRRRSSSTCNYTSPPCRPSCLHRAVVNGQGSCRTAGSPQSFSTYS